MSGPLHGVTRFLRVRETRSLRSSRDPSGVKPGKTQDSAVQNLWRTPLDVVILPLVVIASVLIRAILKQPLTASPSPTLGQVGSSWVAIGLTLVIGGLLVPFAEELFFRGVLYNFMQERWGMWIGALGSALIFAIGHFSVSNAVSAFIFGFFFAVAYERSTSLWTSVLMHAALDSTVLVLFFLSVGSIKT